MPYNREEAAQRAERARTNVPGTCQLWTRTMLGGLSAGDFDGDGDADAVDGWKASTHQHPGDRKPPRGVPVAWSGGSKGYGHRAISLGPINGVHMIRTTDFKRGIIGTVPLDWVEKNWGQKYLGWSEDITGQMIPLPPGKPAAPKESRGVHIDDALAGLLKSKGTGERRVLLDQAIETLRAMPLIK